MDSCVNLISSEYFLLFRPINLTACHVSENHLLIGRRFFRSTNMATITSSANDPYSEKKKRNLYHSSFKGVVLPTSR